MIKKATIQVNGHLEPKCPNRKCEGILLLSITAEEKARVRCGEEVKMGEHKFSCNHVHSVVAVIK